MTNVVNMNDHGQSENNYSTHMLRNPEKPRKFFILTLDSVSRFAIVLLIPVSSISLYPSPSCFTMLGFGGVATAGVAALGAAGRGTRREKDYKNFTSVRVKLMFHAETNMETIIFYYSI
jgi:hypothetical protein